MAWLNKVFGSATPEYLLKAFEGMYGRASTIYPTNIFLGWLVDTAGLLHSIMLAINLSHPCKCFLISLIIEID